MSNHTIKGRGDYRHDIVRAVGGAYGGLFGTGFGSVAGPLGSATGAALGTKYGTDAGDKVATYLFGKGDYFTKTKSMRGSSKRGKYGLKGRGDYKMGYTPGSNSVWNSTTVPKFSNKGRGNIITNREYISDVFTATTGGGADFHNTRVVINPGLPLSFPWLSTLAQNYEQYRIMGMIFEFKSTLGDNSGVQNVGTVIMGTEYNVTAIDYPTKQVMENAEFSQSGKSVLSQIHGIECAPKETAMKMQYVRTGTISASAIALGDGIKWYDFANFQIATVGFSTAGQNIGELWVSYQIEFFKPQIPRNIGGAVQFVNVQRTNCSAASYYGTAVSSSGNLIVSFPALGQIRVSGLYVGNAYEFRHYWVGTAAATTNLAFILTNPATAPGKLLYNGLAANSSGTPGAAVTTYSAAISFTAISNAVTLGLSIGIIPTAANLSFICNGVDNEV